MISSQSPTSRDQLIGYGSFGKGSAFLNSGVALKALLLALKTAIPELTKLQVVIKKINNITGKVNIGNYSRTFCDARLEFPHKRVYRFRQIFGSPWVPNVCT